jgi:hypothetical protein
MTSLSSQSMTITSIGTLNIRGSDISLINDRQRNPYFVANIL